MAIKWIGSEFILRPYSYEMIDSGFKKEWIVEYETFIMPMILIGASTTVRLLKPGRINYTIYWCWVIYIPIMIFKVYVYYDWTINGNVNRTYILSILGCFGVIAQQICLIMELGFINLVCDVVVGGTHQTLLLCFLKISMDIPGTFSLYMCDYISYGKICFIGIGILILMVLVSKRWSVLLDEADMNDFRIYKVTHDEKAKTTPRGIVDKDNKLKEKDGAKDIEDYTFPYQIDNEKQAPKIEQLEQSEKLENNDNHFNLEDVENSESMDGNADPEALNKNLQSNNKEFGS